MAANKSTYLLAAFLGILAARGLGAEGMDPWRGWIAFKQFVRETVEIPDPGISVQITTLARRGPIQMVFLRQDAIERRGRLYPTGGVVCEFWFAPRHKKPPAFEAWSFESPTFDRFVDLVEQHPLFADLLTTRPLRSWVYWEDA
jgi:hypothetical protein